VTFFGLRVKLLLVTTSLTTQRGIHAKPKDMTSDFADLLSHCPFNVNVKLILMYDVLYRLRNH